MAAYSNQGELVAENLHGIASEVRIVSLPGITKKGGDVFDWLEASDDPDQLLNIANAAPIWEPDAPLVKFSDEQSLPNGHEPAETVTVAPAFSDVALSLRFIERHASSLRYEAALGKWFRYDGTRWVTENTLHAFDCARRICQEAAAESNKSSIARAIASAKTVAAVERLAKANHRLASTTDQWDTNLWLLNTPDGAVDLKTGKMRAHQPNDYFTKTTAVSPSTANCPRWKSHLHRVLDGNAELIAYVQRVFGYCLTGVTTEHALFFCYGTGGNGKGETLHTVANILKDYAQSASIMTFIASPFDRHLTELATLRGARAVTATETEKNRGWKESLIKQLTGGE